MQYVYATQTQERASLSDAALPVLEIIGDERPRLSFQEQAIRQITSLAPTECVMRVIEIRESEDDDERPYFEVMNRLRDRALRALATLEGEAEDQGVYEISRRPRRLPSTSTALREFVQVGSPAVVLDVNIPQELREDRGVLFAKWRRVLERSEESQGKARILRPPPAAPAAAAAAKSRIDALLADSRLFKDSTSVGRALSGNPRQANPKMVASRARKRGEIFGVWDGNAFRYPAFQFDADGQPRADVAELVSVLPRDADGSGRDAALWLFNPDAAMYDRTPADVFPEDPGRVILLARRRRDGGDDVD